MRLFLFKKHRKKLVMMTDKCCVLVTPIIWEDKFLFDVSLFSWTGNMPLSVKAQHKPCVLFINLISYVFGTFINIGYFLRINQNGSGDLCRCFHGERYWKL